MQDKSTKKINDFIQIEISTSLHRNKVENYVVCEIIKSSISELNDIGTWYNCLDSRGKKVVIFDVFNKGKYGFHSKGKWLDKEWYKRE